VPTYEYACTMCDHTFEQVQAFSDDSLTVCPDCGGALRKLYGAVGVVFKGSGFYRTDSRKAEKSGKPGGAGKSEKSEKSETKSDSTSTPTKTDSSSTPTSTPTPAAASTPSSKTTKTSTAGTKTS
jgi:putative FmdB family regulatory protein